MRGAPLHFDDRSGLQEACDFIRRSRGALCTTQETGLAGSPMPFGLHLGPRRAVHPGTLPAHRNTRHPFLGEGRVQVRLCRYTDYAHFGRYKHEHAAVPAAPRSLPLVLRVVTVKGTRAAVTLVLRANLSFFELATKRRPSSIWRVRRIDSSSTPASPILTTHLLRPLRPARRSHQGLTLVGVMH